MKIRTVAADSFSQQALSGSINRYMKYLALDQRIIDAEGEVFIIFAEHPSKTEEHVEFSGLDMVIEMGPIDVPIIIMSIFDEGFFLKGKDTSEKFKAAMGKKNVGFFCILNPREDLIKKYKEILGKDVEDKLPMEIYKKSLTQRFLLQINHSYARYLRKDKEKTEEAIKKARDFGIKGTDDEVLSIMENIIVDFARSAYYSGKQFSGVFVDLEGTLIKDGQINQNLLSYLKNTYEGKKPITLWTGGDTKDYSGFLVSNKIYWNLVSKHDLGGAEVEIAIDDGSEEFLKKTYDISIKEYFNVEDIL